MMTGGRTICHLPANVMLLRIEYIIIIIKRKRQPADNRIVPAAGPVSEIVWRRYYMNRRRYRCLFVVLVLGVLLTASAVQAKGRDVTGEKKKEVQKIVQRFDGFLGYGCSRRTKFKFDDYARTTMLCMQDESTYSGKYTLNQIRKRSKDNWNKYFSAKVNCKMKKRKGGFYDGSPSPWTNPSYLFQVYKGKATYLGGDWGEMGPQGSVKKITQNSAGKYTVTYDIKWYNYSTGKTGGKMGTYKITLVASKKNPTLRISNIKRISAKVDAV